MGGWVGSVLINIKSKKRTHVHVKAVNRATPKANTTTIWVMDIKELMLTIH
jgi:hypothetical protein